MAKRRKIKVVWFPLNGNTLPNFNIGRLLVWRKDSSLADGNTHIGWVQNGRAIHEGFHGNTEWFCRCTHWALMPEGMDISTVRDRGVNPPECVDETG